MTRFIEPGVPFTIGDIPVCKCPGCGVTRELTQFYRPGHCNKPAHACQLICGHCR